MARGVTPTRGTVWYAKLPRLGDRPVLVVSADLTNLVLGSVIVAGITSVERERSLPTFVPVEEDDLELPRRSFVVCHDLATLPKRALRRKLGSLSSRRMQQVETALRRALDL